MMAGVDVADGGVGDARARRKAQTRRRLRESALRLFEEQGYESTTVEQIADSAGVSHMTFFRYFGSKEEVVFAGEHKSTVVEHLVGRPMSEAPIDRICKALTAGLAQLSIEDRQDLLRRTRLMLSTPGLRARYLQRQPEDQRLIVEALRTDPTLQGDDMRLWVLSAACVAATAIAVRFWVEAGGQDDLVGLVEQAFQDLREGFRQVDQTGSTKSAGVKMAARSTRGGATST
jgi:AcrR family transcriptional regulator